MRVHLVHWDPVEAPSRVAALEALGHVVTHIDGSTGTPLMRALRGGNAEIFVVDLGRRPSHGREVAMALRLSPATRQRPIVFAGGESEAVTRLRGLLPDATFTTWGRMRSALPKAARTQPASPVVPPDVLYAGRTVAQKLGLKAGETVAAIGAPPGFAALLGALPAGTRLTAAADANAHRFVWFVRSRGDLQLALGRLQPLVRDQVAWLVWPKRQSHQRTDITGNDVRDAGIASGLVDFKVCSVDATWSGLAFKRRRGR